MPVGYATAVLPGLTTLTVAVNITDWPCTERSSRRGDQLALVFALLTTWVTAAEVGLGTKFASPLVYAAVIGWLAVLSVAMVKVAWSWPLTTLERSRPDRRAVVVEGHDPGRDRIDRRRWQGDGDRGREGHALAGDRGRRRRGEGRRRDGRLDRERQVRGIQRGVEQQAVAEDDPVVEAEISGVRGEGQGLERVAQSGLEAVDDGDIDRAAERRGARDGELVVLAAGRRCRRCRCRGRLWWFECSCR